MRSFTYFALATICAVTLLRVDAARAQSPFWESLNGPYGGKVVHIYSDRQGMVAAATLDGLIFISFDDGLSWNATGWTRLTVNDLLITDTGVILAATGSGIFRSADRGTTWTLARGTPTSALARNRQGAIVFGGDGADERVGISNDGGRSWNLLDNGLPFRVGTYAPLFLDDDGEIFTAFNGVVIYKYWDSGESWQPFSEITIGATAIQGLDDRNLLIQTRTGHLVLDIESKELSSRNDGLPAPFYKGLARHDADSAFYTSSFSQGIYKLRDGSVTWEPVSSTKLVQALTFGSNREVIAGSNTGVWRQNKGNNTITQQNEGLVNSSVFVLAFHPDGHLFTAETQRVARWDIGAGAWEHNQLIFNTEQWISALAVGIDRTIYVAIDTTLFRSTDNGRTFLSMASFSTAIKGILSYVTGELSVWTNNRKVLFFDPRSSRWETVLEGNINNVVQTVNNEFFALTSTGILRSQFNARNWTRLGIINGDITDLARVDDHSIVFASERQIFASYDNGVTFVKQSNRSATHLLGLPNQTVVGVELGSLIVSDDLGAHWQHVSAGSPPVAIQALAYSDGFLYAGTDGLGVIRSAEPVLTNVNESDECILIKTPEVAVTPNPIADHARITVAVKQTGTINLEIFDNLGHKVADLSPLLPLAAGSHTIHWDTGKLPSGVYYLSLHSGAYRTVRTAVIQR